MYEETDPVGEFCNANNLLEKRVLENGGLVSKLFSIITKLGEVRQSDTKEVGAIPTVNAEPTRLYNLQDISNNLQINNEKLSFLLDNLERMV